jgi:beta-galactosidase
VLEIKPGAETRKCWLLMKRESFNSGWFAGPKVEAFAALNGAAPELQPVFLPHDAIRDLVRAARSDQGSHTGYYPGGVFTYSKTFDVPADYRDKVIIMEFEGVYRDAVVYINGDFAAQRPNGYAGFAVKADPYLRYGQPNTITVEARSHQDSRWYSGAGIYRNVNISVSDPVHVALDGVRVTTPDIDRERAIVAVATSLENETRARQTVRVATRILDPHGSAVASGSAPVTLLPGTTAVSHVRLPVPTPALWSPDSPFLYEVCTTVLREGQNEKGEILDQARSWFGIHRLQLDPQHGLRINGQPVKLRGACIHHDIGLLGAAAIARAEERRIEIMKAAGFNAIRSAHNPVSRTTLDACDRIGMLVMDELTDVWTRSKTSFDYSLAFPEWWERDLEAMVVKDFNHPSVIMYSIGNEIFEVGTPIGSTWGRRLAEKIRSLDDTRFVTNGLNGLIATMDRLGSLMGAAESEGPRDVNTMIAALGQIMNQLSASDMVTLATEESAAVLDVVGWNYADARYELDADRFPNRVIVGSETFPGHIDELWRLVQAQPHVIGDFTWTGWDYLGEAGIGRVDYIDGESYLPSGGSAPYPYLLANVGDIDITGQRRTISYYRETVYGLRHTPYIAVHPPQHHGRPTLQTPWAWNDSVSSWSWNVPAGSPVTVDVYSDAEEIELLLNSRSLGIAKVGGEKPFLARFETAYEPGELTAVARTSAGEQGRSSLGTAIEPLALQTSSDRTAIQADDRDLAYVEIRLRDAGGNVATDHDRLVAVVVEGPGTLAGLGTGRPSTEEPFGAAQCTTYNGRALAIIRPQRPGEIKVTVSAAGCDPVSINLHAEQPEQSG